MPVYIGRKADAESWWAFCLRWTVLIIFALIFYLFLNWVIACVITMLIRPWQSNTFCDPRTFQSWKLPWELAASACAWTLIIGYLILYSGFGFFYQPIQKSKGLVINLETRAEPMPVDNEDTNDPLATTASQASSADIWSNANDIVGLEPLSLLTTPNTDLQEPHWSTQILAQLEAVSSYENDGQPHAPRYGEILVSSHHQAPRPRHDQGLAAVSSSYQLPMATMSPTQVLSPITRPSHLLRTSRDPTRADVVSWLHSIDLTLPDDLTPPATPTDLHSVRPEQLPPIAPSAVAPETAALSQDMPSPGDQIVPHRQAEERWSSRSRSSSMPSSGNQVTWERTRFFHASHSRS